MKNLKHIAFVALLVLVGASSCRHDDVVYPQETVRPGGEPELTDISGFYLLNEGNMGSNKATLDYYDYASATYMRNIYGERNPDVPMELGDVGNDLQIYAGRLYAVINCSNKIEVMDAATCRRIGQIDIPNCRYIRFYGGYGYATSYAGPVEITENYAQKGYVAKIDLATLEVVDKCIVGYQPDGLAIYKGKIYVANSGGYMVPNYEDTVSVIDLATFKVCETIKIAINLDKVLTDRYGRLWVSSRGDYYTRESALYCYDVEHGLLLRKFNVPVSDMDLCNDDLYIVSTSWDYLTMSDKFATHKIHVSSLEVEAEGIVTDGTLSEMKKPYGIKVNPITNDVLITDARTYINPGYLYCFSPEGVMKWKVRTGDIPAHICFFQK